MRCKAALGQKPGQRTKVGTVDLIFKGQMAYLAALGIFDFGKVTMEGAGTFFTQTIFHTAQQMLEGLGTVDALNYDEVDGKLSAKWSTDTCHPNLECYRTVMEPMVCEAIDKVLKTPKKKLHTAMSVE